MKEKIVALTLQMLLLAHQISFFSDACALMLAMSDLLGIGGHVFLVKAWQLLFCVEGTTQGEKKHESVI